MQHYTQQFLELAIAVEALRFGGFTLKSGRHSPYFFNAGQFCRGQALHQLCACYRDAMQQSGIQFDMLFGPAYKGIPLAAALASEYAVERHANPARDLPWSYNRKEVKDHGEGGQLVGAPLQGKVVIIDDVLSAGTSAREAIDMIKQAGAEPAALLIALDREERGQTELSAQQELIAEGIPVVAIARLQDLIGFMGQSKNLQQHKQSMLDYQSLWSAF